MTNRCTKSSVVEVEGMLARYAPGQKVGPARGFSLVTLEGEKVSCIFATRDPSPAWRYPEDDPARRPITLTFMGRTYRTNQIEWL